MLVLLSFALVLVATVLLVLGLLSDSSGLTLIYLSIASSVAAAIVLVVALKLNKPRDEVRATAPQPLPVPEPEPVKEMATVGAAPKAAATADEEWLAADQDTWSADDGWDSGDEVEFPIADYDSLTSGQILPLLPQLYADEIPIVEERERATKARPEILQKLEQLAEADSDTAPDVADEPAVPLSEAPRTSDPLASYTEPPAAASSWDDDEWFPIEDYESLSAAQIRPLLSELDAEELAMVRDKELELGRRRSLLDEIDRLLPAGGAPAATAPAAPQPAASGRTTAPAKKPAAAKKAASPAKKAPAPAKKAASPAKKAAGPAKKAAKATASKASASTSKAGSAKKAPAKKAVTAKSAGKKAPATKKAAAKKTTATSAGKRSTSAKKSPAKKSSAKKATKR